MNSSEGVNTPPESSHSAESAHLTDEQVAPFAEVMAKAMGNNPHAWRRNEDGSWLSGEGTVGHSLRMAHLHAAHGVLATGVVILPPAKPTPDRPGGDR